MVSIIVPFFNRADSLPRCMESIAAQTYRNFEAIGVNDGSTDASAAVWQAMARRDGRFLLAQRENGGPGAARNTGLALAKGDFITFLDSDDALAPDFLEKLLPLLDGGADVAVGVTVELSQQGTLRHESIPGLYGPGAFLRGTFLGEQDGANAFITGGRVWRGDFLRGNALSFSEKTSWGEDHLFMLDGLAAGARVAVADGGEHYHTLNRETLSGHFRPQAVWAEGEILRKTEELRRRFALGEEDVIAALRRTRGRVFIALARNLRASGFWPWERAAALDTLLAEEILTPADAAALWPDSPGRRALIRAVSAKNGWRLLPLLHREPLAGGL